VPILVSHPPFKYKSNILNRPLGSGGLGCFHPRIRGSGWLGLLDIGLSQEIWTHVHL